MAFFDFLGRTVSEAGQKTIAKTKEFADTSRLNAMISDEEKIVRSLYYQIGKKYVSIHKDDYEEAFADMIVSITDTEGRIRAYKKLIQEIRGVRRCVKCGEEVPGEAAFCSFCGTPIPKNSETASEDYVRCNSCGAYVKNGMRFCTSCGRPLNTVAIPQKTAEVEEYVSSEKLCPNCGASMDVNLLYCTECGTKL